MAFAGRVLVLSSLALALAACGGGNKSGVPKGAPGELSSFAKEWPAPNQDLANRRVATSKINSGNVSRLGVAWTIPAPMSPDASVTSATLPLRFRSSATEGAASVTAGAGSGRWR